MEVITPTIQFVKNESLYFRPLPMIGELRVYFFEEKISENLWTYFKNISFGFSEHLLSIFTGI